MPRPMHLLEQAGQVPDFIARVRRVVRAFAGRDAALADDLEGYVLERAAAFESTSGEPHSSLALLTSQAPFWARAGLRTHKRQARWLGGAGWTTSEPRIDEPTRDPIFHANLAAHERASKAAKHWPGVGARSAEGAHGVEDPRGDGAMRDVDESQDLAVVLRRLLREHGEARFHRLRRVRELLAEGVDLGEAIDQAAEEFGVTTRTIRRDIDAAKHAALGVLDQSPDAG